MLLVDDLMIVAGGEQPQSTFVEVEAFSFKENRWVRLDDLPSPRHGLAAVVLDGKLYVIGGGKRPGLSVSGSNEVLEITTKMAR